MAKFQKSEVLSMYLGFVVALSNAIRGHKLSDSCHASEGVVRMTAILHRLIEWIEEIPPSAASLRYGNPAYRTWQSRLEAEGPTLVEDMVPPELKEAVPEIYPYFADGFGNATRIDYGTGHEVNFAAFLLCLVRLGVLRKEDYQAIVGRIFVKYLDLMRKLQTTYWLEPAGSHGVWGLDDYHFLPFIFGSSQLIDHKYIRPKSIHTQDVLEQFGGEYLYLGAVQFIKRVKKGPLAEHSPILNDICAVPNWAKVHGGLLKMYRAECLAKIPIMQHFLFGSILHWPEG